MLLSPILQRRKRYKAAPSPKVRKLTSSQELNPSLSDSTIPCRKTPMNNKIHKQIKGENSKPKATPLISLAGSCKCKH